MDNRHPKCECEGEQNVVPLANTLLEAVIVMMNLRGVCSLNMMVVVQLVATYLRDSFEDEAEARAAERDAANRAEQIYVRSQRHYEDRGVRTSLSKRRSRLC